MLKKRIFPLILIVFLFASMFALQVNAVEYCYSSFGTPTIDGEKDVMYDGSSMIKVGDANIVFATVWTLWDETNLYIFSQVYDKTVVDTPSTTSQGWLSDSIEVFIDRNNAKTAPYQEDDLQVTIDVTGNLSGQNLNGYGKDKIGNDLDGVVYKTKKNSVGYTIEESIPLESITGADGKKIGLDIGINNANIPGVRENYLTWGGGGNGGTNGWNTLVMMTTVPEDYKQSVVSQKLVNKGDNVALFAFASMNLAASFGNVPFYAVDGNDASYSQASDNTNWILQVDLGSEVFVDKFALKMNSSNYMKNFYFEYSTDNYFWSKLDDKLFENPRIPDDYINYEFSELSMRYVRLVPTSIAGGERLYGHAIHELKVFSSKDQTIILPDKLDDRGALKFTYSDITKSIIENNEARFDATKNGAVKDLYAIYLANLQKQSSSSQVSSQESSSSISSNSISSSTSKETSTDKDDIKKGSSKTLIYIFSAILLLAILVQLFFILNRKYNFIKYKK